MNTPVSGLAVLIFALALCEPPCQAQWSVQESGTKARLRGLSVVDSEVAWASGSKGTVILTIDGGKAWRARTVPGSEGLDFRDVHAVDARTAYLLSIGEGDRSRIYKTTDGGETWALRYTNRDPRVFLDAIAFWDADHGLVLGDPVEGRYTILTTDDGGKSWDRAKAEGMPPSLPDEGAFAASGTCLVTRGDRDAWFGTGGAKVSRVFRSTDRGKTWTAHETPVMASAPSAGIFSLAFQDADHGVAVGGDYKEPGRSGNLVALTSDGGRTWRLPKGQGPGGYRSAVSCVPGTQGRTLVAVGPGGADISLDGGESWRPLGSSGSDSVAFASPTAGWASGVDGLVAKFDRGTLEGR